MLLPDEHVSEPERFRLDASAQFKEDIRGSRFLAFGAPVKSEQEARDFIRLHSDSDATHNCWAYRIGGIYRSDDDGEPGGTAGRPILSALDHHHLDETAVLVARWFGGVKLGAGGLVRAYGGVAAKLLDRAAKSPIIPMQLGTFFAPFALYEAFGGFLGQIGGSISRSDFLSSGVQIVCQIPKAQWRTLEDWIQTRTRGAGVLRPVAPPSGSSEGDKTI